MNFATKISIITPNFNKGEFINDTIQSVISQTYKNWEMIIIDDGSTDNSIKIVKKIQKKEERIRFYKRERQPKGASACRNIGAKLAKGEYLFFLDSDDLLTDFCLKQRTDIINQNQNLDFAVFNMGLFYNKIGDSTRVFNKFPTKNDTFLKMFLRDDLPWACPCPLWEKNFFLKIGGFDENFWIMDDPELHTRALLEPNVKYKVMENSNQDCYYRIGLPNNEMRPKFIKESIIGRISYYKTIVSHINKSVLSKKEIEQLKVNVSIGIKNTFSNWIFSRIVSFNIEAKSFFIFSKKSKLISKFDLLLIEILLFLWNNNYGIVKFLKIKGIVYKLLLK